MENNKYKGTMYERFDSTLTDRMLAADHLVKKLEFLNEHLDSERLSSSASFLEQLELDLVRNSVTPHFRLTHTHGKCASDLLQSILFQARRIFNEIRYAWLSSRECYTPTLELCVNNLSQRINEKDDFRVVLNRMAAGKNFIY